MSKRFKKFVEMKNSIKIKSKIGSIHDDFKTSDSLFKKSSKESNKQHLRRVDKEIQKRKLESEFSKKFNVQITRDEQTGEIKVKKDKGKIKQQKELLQQAKSRIQHQKLQAQTILKPTSALKETEEFVVPKIPLKNPKKARTNHDDEEILKQDYIGFGETNKQPPSLAPFLKKSKTPGKRNLLLLSAFNDRNLM